MTYNNLKQLASLRRIILGTRSPRRIDLLSETGVEFTQIIPELQESREANEKPYDFAQRLACDKAKWVAKRINSDQLVIGCDTIVVLGDEVLQKPTDKEDAFKILSTLSGRQHVVCTALAIADAVKILASGCELTEVYFNPVTHAQINDYINTEEPMDKAGAYGIQGMGAFLVDRIEGNLDNVIGLPRRLLDRLTGEILDIL